MEPARRLLRVVERPIVQHHAPEMILPIGIAKIGGRELVHLPRAAKIRLDLRIRDAGRVVVAERNERIRHVTRLRRARVVVRVIVRDAAEELERLDVGTVDALPFGIHAAELPLSCNDPLIGGVLERDQRLFLLPVTQRASARPKGLKRRDWDRRRRECGRAIHSDR